MTSDHQSPAHEGGPGTGESTSRLLVDSARRHAIFALDPGGHITSWNRGAERITGYTADEVLGQHLSLLDVPEAREHSREVLRRAEHQEHHHEEGWRVKKDGSRIWAQVDVTARRDEQGQLIGFTSVVCDRTEHRSSEDARRSSEARYSGIVAASLDAIVSLDSEQRIVTFNRGAEQMFGYRAEEVLGQPADILIPARLRGLHREHVRAYVDSPPGVRHLRGRNRVVGRRKSGEEFPAEASISVIAVDGERVYTAILRDVTESVTAEARLRDSERRLSLAIEASRVGIFEYDEPMGPELYCSERWAEILGYRAEELPSHRHFRTWLRHEVVHPDDRERVTRAYAEFTAGKRPRYQVEVRLRHKSGRWVWTRCHADATRRDQANRARHVVGVLFDITEAKRAEQAQRLLAEVGNILASALDPDTRVRRMARQVASSFADWCVIGLLDEHGDIEPVAITARDPDKSKLLHELVRRYPYTTGPDARLVGQVIRSGRARMVQEVTSEHVRAASEDERHQVLLEQLGPRSSIIIPLVARGRTLGMILLSRLEASGRFNTEDFALAKELARRTALAIDNARLYAEAQRAIRARDELQRIVAHDLRNPLNTLNAVLGIFSLHMEKSGLEPGRHLDVARRAIGQMDRLIQDLLDVAQLEAGTLSIERARHAPDRLIAEEVEQHSALAAERAIELTAHAPSTLPAIHADRDRIQQVLSNLIGNALKFTPSGGRVEVRAECHDRAVRFSVADTGPGVPEEQLPHLFDQFWQADKHRRQGVGLGLAIARGIVEAHGGRIWAERRPGAGAAFCFTVPTAAS